MKNEKKIFGKNERLYLLLSLLSLSYFVISFAVMYLEMNYFGGDETSVALPFFLVITAPLCAFYGRFCVKKCQSAMSLQLILIAELFVWSLAAFGMYYGDSESVTLFHVLLFTLLYTVLDGIVLLASSLALKLSQRKEDKKSAEGDRRY